MWRTMLCTRRVMMLLQLLVVGTLRAASMEEEEAVEVLYRQQTIPVSIGSSVKLVCKTRFNLSLCGPVHAVWKLNNTELTDPDRYLTTVNETHLNDNNHRLRWVVTEIVKVGREDGGDYQCFAMCTTKKSAVGHVIRIDVQG